MSREIGLAGVKLAPFTGAHNLNGVSDRGGPIEALVERIAHKGAQRRVVTTHARMNVPNELATVGDGMHRCKMPDAVRLYSLLSIIVSNLIWPSWRRALRRTDPSGVPLD
jgi:hypothetical protein